MENCQMLDCTCISFKHQFHMRVATRQSLVNLDVKTIPRYKRAITERENYGMSYKAKILHKLSHYFLLPLTAVNYNVPILATLTQEFHL